MSSLNTRTPLHRNTKHRGLISIVYSIQMNVWNERGIMPVDSLDKGSILLFLPGCLSLSSEEVVSTDYSLRLCWEGRLI